MDADTGSFPAALAIDPNAVYHDGTLVLALGLTHATLARERRAGRLRFARKGKRILYLGAWIIQWLQQDSPAPVSHEL